eukprot:scaffold48881_cov63-Phaeocystis_antarctica.AAC.1
MFQPARRLSRSCSRGTPGNCGRSRVSRGQTRGAPAPSASCSRTTPPTSPSAHHPPVAHRHRQPSSPALGACARATPASPTYSRTCGRAYASSCGTDPRTACQRTPPAAVVVAAAAAAAMMAAAGAAMVRVAARVAAAAVEQAVAAVVTAVAELAATGGSAEATSAVVTAHCRVQGQVRFKAQFQHVEESDECNRSNDSTAHVKSAETFARTALKTATPPRGCFRRCGTGCTRYGRVPVPAHTLYASGCASYTRGWHRIRLVASMRAAVMHRPNCHPVMHTVQPRGWCSGCRSSQTTRAP